MMNACQGVKPGSGGRKEQSHQENGETDRRHIHRIENQSLD